MHYCELIDGSIATTVYRWEHGWWVNGTGVFQECLMATIWKWLFCDNWWDDSRLITYTCWGNWGREEKSGGPWIMRHKWLHRRAPHHPKLKVWSHNPQWIASMPPPSRSDYVLHIDRMQLFWNSTIHPRMLDLVHPSWIPAYTGTGGDNNSLSEVPYLSYLLILLLFWFIFVTLNSFFSLKALNGYQNVWRVFLLFRFNISSHLCWAKRHTQGCEIKQHTHGS